MLSEEGIQKLFTVNQTEPTLYGVYISVLYLVGVKNIKKLSKNIFKLHNWGFVGSVGRGLPSMHEARGSSSAQNKEGKGR